MWNSEISGSQGFIPVFICSAWCASEDATPNQCSADHLPRFSIPTLAGNRHGSPAIRTPYHENVHRDAVQSKIFSAVNLVKSAS